MAIDYADFHATLTLDSKVNPIVIRSDLLDRCLERMRLFDDLSCALFGMCLCRNVRGRYGSSEGQSFDYCKGRGEGEELLLNSLWTTSGQVFHICGVHADSLPG